jgi:hypothetical protein
MKISFIVRRFHRLQRFKTKPEIINVGEAETKKGFTAEEQRGSRKMKNKSF